MTDQELAEIKSRCEKATPGPWTYECVPYNRHDDSCILSGFCTDDPAWEYWSGFVCQTTYDTLSGTERPTVDSDTIFIAHARTDIPRLLEEIERLRTERDDVAKIQSLDRGTLVEIARAIDAPDREDGSMPIEELPSMCERLRKIEQAAKEWAPSVCDDPECGTKQPKCFVRRVVGAILRGEGPAK